jgi:hypothetical protein
MRVVQGVHKTIQRKQNYKGHEIKEAMTLHHHRHSPLQKNLWCNNTKLFFLSSSMHAPADDSFGTMD